jgi:hypothetical protein
LAFEVDLELEQLGVFVKFIDLFADVGFSWSFRIMVGFRGSLGVVDRPAKNVIIVGFVSDFAGLLINMSETFFEAVDILVVEDVFASWSFVFTFVGFVGI